MDHPPQLTLLHFTLAFCGKKNNIGAVSKLNIVENVSFEEKIKKKNVKAKIKKGKKQSN